MSFSQTQKIIGGDVNHMLAKNVDGLTYEADRSIGFYLGAQFDDNRIILSYKTSKDSSSNGASSINVKNMQLALLYKREFRSNDANVWKTYLGIGLGQAWSKVDSTIGSSSVQSNGNKELVAILDLEVTRNIYKKLWYAFGLSALSSEAYSLNPTVELSLLKLYFLF